MKKLLARYFRVSRHRSRRWLSVPTLRRTLGDRVRSYGIDRPAEPDYSDEPTVQLKTTVAVIEPHETGIGILRPVVDSEDDDGCDSVSDDNYQCEVKGDHDTCSACDGEFIWPREAALAVTAA